MFSKWRFASSYSRLALPQLRLRRVDSETTDLEQYAGPVDSEPALRVKKRRDLYCMLRRGQRVPKLPANRWFSWRGVGAEVVYGLTPDNADGTVNENDWTKACRRTTRFSISSGQFASE